MKIGEYQRGADPRTDRAIDKQDAIRDFLRQRTDELNDFDTILARLRELAQ